MELEQINYRYYLQVNDDKVIITSKMVAELFGKRHDHVLRDIRQLIESDEIGLPKIGESDYSDSRGKQQPMYILDRDSCMVLCMGFNGKEAIKFRIGLVKTFNAMEIELIRLKTFSPVSKLDYIRLALEQEIKIQEQSQQLAIAEPKAEYFDNVLQSSSAITITIIAKEMGMSASSLNKMMEKDGIICKIGKSDQWFATAKYQDKGYVCDKTTTYKDSEGKINTKHHTYWTELGRHFIINKYSKIKEKYNDLFNLVSK